jgi:hypothetical protein
VSDHVLEVRHARERRRMLGEVADPVHQHRLHEGEGARVHGLDEVAAVEPGDRRRADEREYRRKRRAAGTGSNAHGGDRDPQDVAEQMMAREPVQAWRRRDCGDAGPRAVAGGIGVGERVVPDVGVAVPGLPVERIAHHRIGAGHAADVRVVDAPVEMHERDAGQHLLPGEAARRLTRDAVGRIVATVVPETPLAQRVVGVALQSTFLNNDHSVSFDSRSERPRISNWLV